jgi:hypothetical protein
VRSFTFDFDRSIWFPARVGLATFAVVVAYNILIWLVRPNAVISYDAGTRNRVIAERYVDGIAPRAVIVGSSLVFRLAADYMRGDYLGPGIFNLGLAGDSSLTGAEIVLRRETLPALVFVEMNVLERPYNEQFVTKVFEQPWRTVRCLAPGLRFENRPIDVAISLTSNALKRVLDNVDRPRAQGVSSNEEGHTEPGSSVALSPGERAVDKRLVSNVQMGLDRLVRQVDALRERNVEVILMHFPVDPAVDARADERYKQVESEARFPRDRYEWLDFRSIGAYQTDDGVHLTVASAREVSTYLRRIADGLHLRAR